jgi:hypothetical protein
LFQDAYLNFETGMAVEGEGTYPPQKNCRGVSRS